MQRHGAVKIAMAKLAELIDTPRFQQVNSFADSHGAYEKSKRPQSWKGSSPRLNDGLAVVQGAVQRSYVTSQISGSKRMDFE